MAILLLGNGFDLYHNLPTKYENFLHTAEFLKNNYCDDIKTIGQVFGNEELQKNDQFIRNSYKKYKDRYDIVLLDHESIEKLVSMSESNLWFNYLLQAFNKDVGWIDFESEIVTVLDQFSALLSDGNITFSLDRRTPSKYTYIIKFFNFFYSANEHVNTVCRIKDEYIIETPMNSRNIEVNTEKIIDDLKKELDEFSEMLKIYLKCFVNNALTELIEWGLISRNELFDDAEAVFTLNYTHTYEKIYNSTDIYHIHGNAEEKIVLGINADESDEIGTLNTSMISFKKYYQRVLYQTDIDYLSAINALKEYSNGVNQSTLYVIGHSLDITDRDIICELFGLASDIVIYYHSEEVVGTYIRNLVSLFGKEGFDYLRYTKDLRFESLY